jgi:transcription termination/antitermination protein NusG
MPFSENRLEKPGPGVIRYWYALYTRHQHEKTVAKILANKGQEVFLPLVNATHQWQDRAKQLWLPLFPSYVFIRGGLGWQVQILGIPGMINIVGWAGHPAIVPQNEIDTIRQIIESSLRVEPHPYLQCGDRVRVEAGPLRGIEGVLVQRKNMFRLVVSVEILGRSAAVEVDISSIKRIDFSPAAMQSYSLSASA